MAKDAIWPRSATTRSSRSSSPSQRGEGAARAARDAREVGRAGERVPRAHAKLSELLYGDGRLQAEHGTWALKAGDREGLQHSRSSGRSRESTTSASGTTTCCALSLAGDVRGAMGNLRRAVENGMAYADMATDADLDNCARRGLRDICRR
jgi:hypothetical protein